MRLVWPDDPEADTEDLRQAQSESRDLQQLVWSEDWDVACVHVAEGATAEHAVELKMHGVVFEARLCHACTLAAA